MSLFSDLRHISNATISNIHLELREHSPSLQVIYLPLADKLKLDLYMVTCMRRPHVHQIGQQITFMRHWALSLI